MNNAKFRLQNILISLAAVAAMWLVWLVAALCVDDGYVIPSAGDTFAELGGLLFGDGAPSYWRAFGMTFARSLCAWAISFAVAAALAALSAANARVRSFVRPFVAVVRILPVMAITLMLLIWSERSVVPVIVCSLTLCPLIYAQLTAALDGIDAKLLEMARVYALPRRDVVFRICLPQMLPPVLSQTGPDLSLALKVTVSAEVLASAFPAIGRLINDAQLYNNTAQVFALTVSMLAVGGLVEFLCSRLTLITARWTGVEGGHAH